MPHFKIVLAGSGISMSMKGSEPAVGFFRTCLVRAPDPTSAGAIAKELVLTDWRSGGRFATSNKGGLPALNVEQASRVGLLRALWSRRPQGYSFYMHE